MAVISVGQLLRASLPILLLCLSCNTAEKLQDVNYAVKSSYDELYADGKLAFAGKRWTEAIEYFEEAMTDYELERKGMSKCYVECRRKGVGKPLPASATERKVIRSLAEQAECAEACKRRTIGLRGPVLYKIRQEFEAAYPFHYLQYAYYQVGNVTEAAKAAVTYAVFNPDDKDMQKNLKLYHASPEVKGMKLLPRLEPTGRVLFTRAANSYHQKSFDVAITTMRLAVDQLFEEYHICRSNCDTKAAFKTDEYGPDETEESFITILLSMQKKQVMCRLQCWVDMGSDFRGYHALDIIPEAFNHIQFACHEDKDDRCAVQAAVDYLAIKPHDQIMKENLQYYKKQGVDASEFTPTESVESMAALIKEDREFLKNIKASLPMTEEEAFREELGLDDPHSHDIEKFFQAFESMKRPTQASKAESAKSAVDSKPGTNDGETGEHSISSKPKIQNKDEVRSRAKFSPVVNDNDIVFDDSDAAPGTAKEKRSLDNFKDVRVVETPEDHNGLHRMLVDGVASEDQCKTMLELTKKVKPGSGYGGRPSPHTTNELFEGLTVSEAAEGAVKGELNINSVLLYLDLAEKSRKFLEQFFNLDNLYFSYSHLVCRTSLLKGASGDTSPDDLILSHPVHADNCILKEDGRCVKESPAYTWRDYSAILYLNDDFTGGDFFFAHRQNQTVQHRVRPSCGRLVGFGADESNLHGVLPLQSGRRCVIALWMTLSPNMDEGDHAQTIQKLGKLREKQASNKAGTVHDDESKDEL